MACQLVPLFSDADYFSKETSTVTRLPIGFSPCQVDHAYFPTSKMASGNHGPVCRKTVPVGQYIPGGKSFEMNSLTGNEDLVTSEKRRNSKIIRG